MFALVYLFANLTGIPLATTAALLQKFNILSLALHNALSKSGSFIALVDAFSSSLTEMCNKSIIEKVR